MIRRQKALVYATWGGKLLVFDEPDFPAVALQIPGGTVDAGEAVIDAARREFHEETGLSFTGELKLLGSTHFDFERGGVIQPHERTYFHAELTGPFKQEWTHYEDDPDGGGSPILFRLFWMDIEQAREKLGFSMGELIGQLSPEMIGR